MVFQLLLDRKLNVGCIIMGGILLKGFNEATRCRKGLSDMDPCLHGATAGIFRPGLSGGWW